MDIITGLLASGGLIKKKNKKNKKSQENVTRGFQFDNNIYDSNNEKKNINLHKKKQK